VAQATAASGHLAAGAIMMAGKPTVVLVHGFWGNAGHWAKVIVELTRRGCTSLHAVENPHDDSSG
jgi:pimeloyl-ACP methyl ester carboxylesterase